MESIRELYKIGYGPSSSHTMGPRLATKLFLKDYPNADNYSVELFGSLAATGKGHLTNVAIESVFKKINKKINVIWKPEEFKIYHPNALTFYSYDKKNNLLGSKTYYSVGGGTVEVEGENKINKIELYDERFDSLDKILAFCEDEGMQLWEFVLYIEGENITEYIKEIWNVMISSIQKGLDSEGVLPGGLKLQRKASMYYSKSQNLFGSLKFDSELISYALAVSEENASGNKIVTAPTCGSCGIVPSVLYYLYKNHDLKEDRKSVV